MCFLVKTIPKSILMDMKKGVTLSRLLLKKKYMLREYPLSKILKLDTLKGAFSPLFIC